MKQRDYYFDNAKFILILLVVFGHLLRALIGDNNLAHTLYMVIYTFHMPAFILVSGFFARGFYQKDYLKKLAKKLLLPYLIFQLIYSGFYYFLNSESQFVFNPFDPHWSLWFLISLFFWHLMLFFFARFKPALGITIALAFALIVGYIDWVSTYLSLSRTIVFFPMFLIGYYLTKEQLLALTKSAYRLLAVGMIVGAFLFYSLFPEIHFEWLFGSKSYSALDTPGTLGMVSRIGYYLLTFIIVFSFLALVPKRKTFFTTLGRNTLYVYLLHGFFIQIFRQSEFLSHFKEFEQLLLVGGIALVLTFFLPSRPVAAVFRPFIELKMSTWTNFRKQEEVSKKENENF